MHTQKGVCRDALPQPDPRPKSWVKIRTAKATNRLKYCPIGSVEHKRLNKGSPGRPPRLITNVQNIQKIKNEQNAVCKTMYRKTLSSARYNYNYSTAKQTKGIT